MSEASPSAPGSPALRLNRVGQIMVGVQDLERAVVFYRDVLGMQHLFTAGGMAFFDCGDVRLMLGVPDRSELEPPGSIVYYRVEDLEGAHRVLTERGVECEVGPLCAHRSAETELWLAFFHDTEGNVFALMSEVAASGEPAPS